MRGNRATFVRKLVVTGTDGTVASGHWYRSGDLVDYASGPAVSGRTFCSGGLLGIPVSVLYRWLWLVVNEELMFMSYLNLKHPLAVSWLLYRPACF